MTNQLFCLATHLRLAMLCLQLGKSCWVLVLDSFFRHEEMSQLRFAEPLFSCHFSKRAIRLVTNCSMGGMVRPINMLGRWWWWWWCLLCLQLLLYFSNYCYYIWLCCTVMTISTSCRRNGAFLASNKSFWNICWVSSGAVKVFGTDPTLPDLVSWNKYTTHLFFKVYINRQKHRFCCQAIPSFPFNSSHETWVTEDAPELEFIFLAESQ